MNPSRPAWRTALVGVALSVALVLLLAPPTGWLARQQFAAAGFHAPQSDEQTAERETAAHVRAAARFPDDVNVQIAAALDRADVQIAAANGDTEAQGVLFRTATLRALVARFPSSPTLYAALLRVATTDGDDTHRVHLSRPEDWLISGHAPPPDAKYTHPDPKLLAQWDADCAAGERLDPQNAFFPMMRAVGLFAAYRDADATQALIRAGDKPLWNDYAQAETQGRLRIYDAATGGQYALGRVAVAAATLFPQFAPMRAMARVAVYRALTLEKAGNVEGGLAIRRALMNVADRMRVQSTSLIGSLVANAIAAIATSRPGGIPALHGTPPAGLNSVQSRHWYYPRRVNPFAAYANAHGHPELADLARRQATADESIHALYHTAEPKLLYNTLVPHTALWLVGETMLAVALWLVLFGIVARLLSLRPAFREVRPLPRSVKWGIVAAVAAALAVFAFNGASGGDVQFNVSAAVACAVAMGAGAAFLLRRRITKPMLARFAAAFVITALVLAAIAGILSWQAHGIGTDWQTVRELQGFSGDGSDMTQAGIALEHTLFVAAGTLALPALLLTIFAVAGRVRRVPVSVAIVRGFLSTSVPAACILVVVWGGLCLVTLRQERQLNAELDHMMTHEGRYYASLAGAEWPGSAVP